MKWIIFYVAFYSALASSTEVSPPPLTRTSSAYNLIDAERFARIEDQYPFMPYTEELRSIDLHASLNGEVVQGTIEYFYQHHTIFYTFTSSNEASLVFTMIFGQDIPQPHYFEGSLLTEVHLTQVIQPPKEAYLVEEIVRGKGQLLVDDFSGIELE